MRSVIVEGPDGSGKTGLVNRLADALPELTRAPRMSSSVDGPVADLAGMVEDSVNRILYSWTPELYDRHGLITEPIYGPLVRGELRPKFEDRIWLNGLRNRIMPRVVVVWCLPGLHHVQNNVGDPNILQMPGVVESIQPLYHAYVNAYRMWGGWSLVWNYTDDSFDHLVSTLKGTEG